MTADEIFDADDAAGSAPFDTAPTATLAQSIQRAADNATAPVVQPTVEETVTSRAVALVRGHVETLDRAEAGLAEVEATYRDVVYDVSTTKGMKEATEARYAIRQKRYAIKNTVDAAKSPLNTLKADIAAQGDKLIKRLKAVEDPIDAQIVAEEQRKEREKEEAARIERERREAIDARLLAIRNLPVGKTTIEQIEAAQAELEAIEVTLDAFDDKAGEAQQAKIQAGATLTLALGAARKLAAEQEELARQQAELERQRAEEEAKRKAEAEAERVRMEEQRKQQEAQAAELARQQEELRKAQEAQAAELKRQQDALAAERAELEKQRAADQARREQEAADAAEAERRKAEEEQKAQAGPAEAYAPAMPLAAMLGAVGSAEAFDAIFKTEPAPVVASDADYTIDPQTYTPPSNPLFSAAEAMLAAAESGPTTEDHEEQAKADERMQHLNALDAAIGNAEQAWGALHAEAEGAYDRSACDDLCFDNFDESRQALIEAIGNIQQELTWLNNSSK